MQSRDFIVGLTTAQTTGRPEMGLLQGLCLSLIVAKRTTPPASEL
jgi:hypothetical protein